MKRNLLIVLCISVLLPLTTSCERMKTLHILCAGVNETRVADITGAYHQLIVNNGIAVCLSTEITEPQIIADRNVIQYVETEEKDGKLNIRYNRFLSIYGTPETKDCIVLIQLPYNARLDHITLYNGSTMRLQGDFKKLEINLTGGAILAMQGSCNDLEAELYNGSIFQAEGVFPKTELKLTGGSIIGNSTYGMHVKNMEAHLYNGSMLSCTADDAVFTGALTGGSIIRYRGTAASEIKLYNGSEIIQEQ